ncbi:hypothetical protein [Pontibacillus sp. ALD_SL1]|nr:hypothetical protein [Pontibacillus sp. ALD_SL1]
MKIVLNKEQTQKFFDALHPSAVRIVKERKKKKREKKEGEEKE